MERATKDDKTLIIDILTDAFDGNKSVNYIIKQDSHRKDRIRGLMEYSFEICHAFGEVWISEDKLACALVLFKDRQKSNLASLLLDVKLALNVIGLTRVLKVLGRESKLKPFYPKALFAYLWFVGVRPESQNRRIGSNLLAELIDRYVKQKRPIYLETSVERNLPWYKNHGFEIYNTLQLTYSLYLLRRLT